MEKKWKKKCKYLLKILFVIVLGYVLTFEVGIRVFGGELINRFQIIMKAFTKVDRVRVRVRVSLVVTW